MSEVQLHLMGPEADAPFPPGDQALRRPNGLLAWGGDLQPARLLRAYRLGIFPWYSEGEPILWWTPNPRCVLLPAEVHVSQRTRRRFNSGRYRVSADTAFAEVMTGCAAPREGQAGTWITPDLQAAFVLLHEQGHAHSIEVWQGEHLVGGLYGMAMGRVFFAESMFSRAVDASKVALVSLCRQLLQWSFGLVDCQVTNPHLLSMGAREIPREEFESRLEHLTAPACPAGKWTSSFSVAVRW